MRNIKEFIKESSVFDDDQSVYEYEPNTKRELIDIIKKRIREEGPKCDLNNIDVSHITDMKGLFEDTVLCDFNGDISQWDVSNVSNMDSMFTSSAFNGDISEWDTHNVKDMSYMFAYSVFNGDISKWDVSNVEIMEYMFKLSDFNGDISKWDVRNVLAAGYMFFRSEFNQDISKWNLNKACITIGMFKDCPIEERYKPNIAMLMLTSQYKPK